MSYILYTIISVLNSLVEIIAISSILPLLDLLINKNGVFIGGVNNFLSKFIDIDQSADLANQYNVRSVPTTVIEENGIEIDRFVGATSKQNVLQRIS